MVHDIGHEPQPFFKSDCAFPAVPNAWLHGSGIFFALKLQSARNQKHLDSLVKEVENMRLLQGGFFYEDVVKYKYPHLAVNWTNTRKIQVQNVVISSGSEHNFSPDK